MTNMALDRSNYVKLRSLFSTYKNLLYRHHPVGEMNNSNPGRQQKQLGLRRACIHGHVGVFDHLLGIHSGRSKYLHAINGNSHSWEREHVRQQGCRILIQHSVTECLWQVSSDSCTQQNGKTHMHAYTQQTYT